MPLGGGQCRGWSGADNEIFGGGHVQCDDEIENRIGIATRMVGHWEDKSVKGKN